jgi:hypothetical protein
MSSNRSGVVIPKRYIKLHPLDVEQASNVQDERPAELKPRDKVRYVLRDGQTGCVYAGGLWWGDRHHELHAIVAYKRIKLENPWIDWGHRYDRNGNDDSMVTVRGIPAGLGATARVQVWLRGYPTPQADVRQAEHWDWGVSGENGGDIMKYRIIN